MRSDPRPIPDHILLECPSGPKSENRSLRADGLGRCGLRLCDRQNNNAPSLS